MRLRRGWQGLAGRPTMGFLQREGDPLSIPGIEPSGWQPTFHQVPALDHRIGRKPDLSAGPADEPGMGPELGDCEWSSGEFERVPDSLLDRRRVLLVDLVTHPRIPPCPMTSAGGSFTLNSNIT